MEQPMQELASRVTRLGAVILNSFISVAVFLPIMAITGMFGQLDQDLDPSLGQLLSIALGGAVLAAVNIYFLVRDGQTIGKKILGIRIVRQEDGQLQSAGKVIGLRYILIQVIAVVPCVGPLFGLVDILFIFREDRRCIHDLIAGTKVVKA